MKFDYSKIKLLEGTVKSERAMAQKIGMSNTGYSKMMKNETCTVETLVNIAHEFNKPIDYFFINEDNSLNENNIEYKTTPPISREKPECTDPKCKEELFALYRENRELRIENKKLITVSIQGQKGGTATGEKPKGGVEKSRKTG